MASARRPIALASAACVSAACTLLACRSILGIDGLPGAEGGDSGQPGDARSDTTPEGCDADLQFDPDNCGACGHRCCGMSCLHGGCVSPTSGGTPRTLEDGSTLPNAIAAEPDGAAVYWSHATTDAGFAIVRLAAGGAQAQTVASGLGYVNAIQVGPDALYASSGSEIVAIAPKAGPGTVTTLATGTLPDGLALAAGQLYWTDWGSGQGTGTINVLSPDGSGAQTLYTSQSSPTGIALSAGALVWTEFEQGHEVVAGTPDGGATNTFSFDPMYSDPGPIVAVDGGVVYGDIAQGRLARWDLGDAAPPQIIAGAQAPGSITAVASDGTYVYFAWVPPPGGAGIGTIYYAPIDGSSAGQTLVPTNLLCPISVATDGRCVYWTNAGACADGFTEYQPEAGTGSVMSIERP